MEKRKYIEDRASDFFYDLIEGNFGLPMTYWAYGVLGGIVWGVAIVSITQALVPMYSQDGLQDVYRILCLLMGGYFISVYIGIWRSSDKYQGAKVWAVLAKFAVVVSAIPMTINILKIMLT